MNIKLLSIVSTSFLITTGTLFASSPTYYEAGDSDVTSYSGLNPDREYRAAQAVDSMEEVTNMNKSFSISKKIPPIESDSMSSPKKTSQNYKILEELKNDPSHDPMKPFTIEEKLPPKT